MHQPEDQVSNYMYTYIYIYVGEEIDMNEGCQAISKAFGFAGLLVAATSGVAEPRPTCATCIKEDSVTVCRRPNSNLTIILYNTDQEKTLKYPQLLIQIISSFYILPLIRAVCREKGNLISQQSF